MSERITNTVLQDDKTFILNIIITTKSIVTNFELIADYAEKYPSVNRHRNFLTHYMSLGWSQMAINVYKLYHKEEKRSFIKILNKLENKRYDNSILKILDESKSLNKKRRAKSHEDIIEIISACKKMIREYDDLITKISNRRNNVYAHGYSPKNKDPKLFTVETREEIKKVLNLTSFVFDQIFGEILGSAPPNDTTVLSIEPLLKELINEK